MKNLSIRNKELTPRMKQVVQAIFDNPRATQKEIGKILGISDSRVNQILRSNRVLEAFPTLAKTRIKQLVPKAVNRFEKLLEQQANPEVARKVTEKILETQGVLAPDTKVQVNIIAQMSTEKVAERVSEGMKIPVKDVFEGEIVESDETSR